MTSNLKRPPVVTGGNASATSIVVGAGEANGVVKNSAVHVIATGETLYLTADPTGGNTLTVSRGFAGTSAQAINYWRQANLLTYPTG